MKTRVKHGIATALTLTLILSVLQLPTITASAENSNQDLISYLNTKHYQAQKLQVQKTATRI